MKRYPKYKDSSVEWIGEIPEHWDVKPLKHILRDGNEGIKIGPFGSSLKLEIMKPDGYKVYGQENIIKDDMSVGHRYIDDSKFSELKVYEIMTDDIVITMMGTTGKSKVIPNGIEKGIMDSHLIRLRSKQNTNPKFISLLINDSDYILTQIKNNSKGAIMEGLNSTIIKSLNIILPPLREQNLLMDFLDHKTNQIDTLIQKKQNQIDLLKEQRTAIINQAVTKGLNPNVKMKDSGIEWVREIPEHWETIQLKHLKQNEPYSFVDGPFGSNLKNEEYTDYGVPLIQLSNIGIGKHICNNVKFISNEKAEQLFKHKVSPNDIVIAKMADPVARAAKVKSDFKEYVIVADCIKLRVTNDIVDVDFLVYSINTDYVRAQAEIRSTGTTRIRIGLTETKRLKVLVPPLFEQLSIAKFLDHKTQQIDTIIKQEQQLITQLLEYRTTLISDVVTGKIDVRDEVIP